MASLVNSPNILKNYHQSFQALSKNSGERTTTTHSMRPALPWYPPSIYGSSSRQSPEDSSKISSQTCSLPRHLNLAPMRSFYFLCKRGQVVPPESGWTPMEPIQEPQPTVNGLHRKLDMAEGGIISEMKHHPKQTAQDAAQKAKEMAKLKTDSGKQEGPWNSDQNPGKRRKDAWESKWNIPWAEVACPAHAGLASDPNSGFQGGESPGTVVDGEAKTGPGSGC